MAIPVSELLRLQEGRLESYSWPGGYDIAYYVQDGFLFCGECAQRIVHDEGFDTADKPRWAEGTDMWEEPQTCDHCGRLVGPERDDSDDGAHSTGTLPLQ